jgi:pimeloyl-ACP methyl ester carboxylesterase
VFVGNSVGGFAGARLAIEQPQRVAGLVLVSTGGFTARTAGSLLACRLLGTPVITRRLLPALVPRYLRPRSQMDGDITRHVRDLARTPAGAGLAAGLWPSFADPSYDLRAHASQIAVPTMLVWGTQDVLLPLRAARETHHALPAAELHLFDTGHVVFASDPAGFLAAVEPFLDTVLKPQDSSG